MKILFSKQKVLTALLTACGFSAHAGEKLFNGEVVSGRISIDFNSRRPEPKADEYTVKLKILGSEVNGVVTRALKTGAAAGPATMSFDLNVGKTKFLEGSGAGAQIIQSSDTSNETFEINSLGLAPVEKFSGAGLADGVITYKSKGEVFVPDLILSYPREKGQTINEVVSGNIKWIKADSSLPNTATSRYEINIYFNRGQGTENSLKGTIFFTDTLDPKDNQKTLKTDAIYEMSAKNLSRDQITNFMKLWLLLIGPLHDD